MDIFEKGLDEANKEIKVIKENHLAHIQGSLNIVVNDMEWIKRFFWILATASIGSLAANIISLMTKTPHG